MTQIESISSSIKTVTLLDQLAEEATELAHAALKASRIMRGENPTPVTLRDAEAMVTEEWTDLCLVADVIGLSLDEDVYDGKLNRWENRLREKTRWLRTGGKNIEQRSECGEEEIPKELPARKKL